MTDEIYETPSTTPNFQTELAAQLADLIPEAIADGKVDVEKLKELLDGDAADGSERFGLFWPGKKRALRAAQEPTTATLKPDFENSKDWDTTQNVFIEGDNLEVLKILQKHYHAKIKLIYIDPPYNTGKDFVYPDNYKEGLDTYLEWTRQVNEEGKKVTTNAETEGRYHSNWLNMMYPRLKLARNLLTDDGVIFISIDDHEVDNLTRLGKEVFGEDNLLACFPRVTKRAGKSGDLIAFNHDYVLAFSRTSGVRLNRFSHTDDGFRFSDEFEETRGKYKLNQTLDYGSIQYSRSLDYEIELDGRVFRPGGVTEEQMLARQARNPRTDFCWRWSRDLFKFGLENGFVVVKDGRNGPRIYTKTYQNATIKERGGGYEVVIQDRTKAFTTLDLVDNKYSNDNAKKGISSLFAFAAFDYTKPVEMLKTIIALSTSPDGGDIVLDFFSGSGTTAHAVMQLNAEDGGDRRHIQVQLPEPTPDSSEARDAGYSQISQISRKRIDVAGDAVARQAGLQLGGREAPLDIGFRSYKLADTSFTKWRLSSDVEEDALQQHLLSLRDSATDDATADDLLTEILLKQGYSLSEDISPAEVGGLDVRLVRDREGDVAVLAYLNEHVKPTLEQLRALVDESPTRIIVLEDAFQGDDELKTNLAQLAKSKGIELWTT
ncbi:site-specific DNA-methyltransferase [Brevibacterium casei]|uniref:site-specific DNA-methyltransferase n=1 Tax=Brevibacterium casei TaxID=33889 RepID=UPI00186B7378|nr:site-specific DNA-methyltransferase [Brevibacterium casei]MBE4693659.1 site-specific DNA-methyltransferase [Brevibacterium casei]MBY3576782.1 site-specific DNA-methyltransferase [Brevibacterium casei]